MKLRRALGAVLALALLPAFPGLKTGPKVRAGTEWDIKLEATTFDLDGSTHLDWMSSSGDLVLEGGTVRLNKYKAESGDKITVTVVPDTGYKVREVDWGNGMADPTDITDTLEFTMWENPAVVSVEFVATQKTYYSYVRYVGFGPVDQTMKNTIFKTKEEADAFVLPVATFPLWNADYEFDYWGRDGDETWYEAGDPCPIGPTPVIFYANYRPVGSVQPYTVQFNPGMGTGSMTSVPLNESTAASYVLPDSEFTPPTNYKFIMWETSYPYECYRVGETCSVPKEGITFQAAYMYYDYFNGSSYGARFNPGEGSGTMPDVTFDNPYDAYEYTLPECSFTAPEGKKFAYWQCVSYSYKPGDRYALPCDGFVTFKAVWTSAIPECYVVSAGALNVRSGPSLYADRIGGLTCGKAIQAIDTSLEDGEIWVSFNYQGQTGWVMRKYLLLTYSVEAAVKPTKCTVSVGVLNVRSSPEIPGGNPDNRITSLTNGKEFVATGVVTGKDNKEWICFEYEKDGKVQLVFVMAKYVEGDIVKKEISAHSLKINFSMPAGELNQGKSAVALSNEVNLSEENLTYKNDGLLKTVIFPEDAYTFASLTKADITLPDGIGMEVMDLVLQEDGSIALTLCPENAVTVSFTGASAGDSFTKYVASGKLIAKPDDPTMEGATFDGWYEDEACTIKFDFSKPVTGNVTLYPKFIKTGTTDSGSEDTSKTEPAKEIFYTATVDMSSWERGSGKGIVVTVKRSENDADLCFLYFRGVFIDGKPLVLDKDYSAKKGSTIVTIYPATLEALGDGEHTVTVEFEDSKTEIKLSVDKPKAAATTQAPAATTVQNTRVPKTGDVAPSYRSTALLVLCVIGLAAVALMDRKKEEEK